MEELIVLVFSLLVEEMEHASPYEVAELAAELAGFELPSASYEVLEALIGIFEEIIHEYGHLSGVLHAIYLYTGESKYLETYVKTIVSVYSVKYEYL